MALLDRIPRVLGGRRPPRSAIEEDRHALIGKLEEAGSILEEIQAARYLRASQPPPYFPPGLRGDIRDNAKRPNASQLLAETQGWQAIAARAIADRIQCLDPLVFAQRRVEQGTVEDVQLDDHPLKVMLDRPSPVFSRIQLMRIIAYWLVQVGDVYLLKVQDQLGVTRGLWPLSPERVQPVMGRANIEKYVFSTQGAGSGSAGQIVYDASEIVRIWEPDPDAIFSGLGSVGANAVAYDTSKYMGESMRLHFQRDATPKTALVAKDGAELPSKDVRSRFEADWRKRYDRRFGRLAGVPAWIPPMFELKEFEAFGGVAEMVGIMSHFREQILMANGVPRSVLGDVVDANRAAAETNQFVFDQHTIKPKADLIADALTWQLAKDYDESLIVRFADFVSADKDYELARERQDVELKIRSINQVLEGSRGDDPVSWGELPVGTLAEVPYTGEEPEEPEEPENPDVGDMLDDEIDDDDDEMEDEPPRGLESEWDLYEDERAARRHRLLESSDMERVLRSIDDSVLLRPMRKVIRESIRVVAQSVIDSGRLKFTIGPNIEDFVQRHSATRIKQIGKTTRTRIQKQLQESLRKGESEAQAARRVRKVFRSASEGRARTIARTETTAASTVGNAEGIRALNYSKKKWLSVRDKTVRETHRRRTGLDGQVVLVDDLFVSPLTGATGLGPGLMDIAEENINCRCTIVPFTGGRENPEQLWRIREKLRLRLERKAIPIFSRAFRKQRDAALRALKSKDPIR